MPEEAVEIVQAHIEAFDRADSETALSYLDPHVVLDPSRLDAVTWEVTLGHDALERVVRRFRGAFKDYSYEVERLTAVGPGAVVAMIAETGLGRSSGIPVERSYAVLYTVVDAKIVRITIFPTEQEALEAAGLSE